MQLLIHSDVVIDRAALAACQPIAWAEALAAEQGGPVEAWQAAYRQVSADWSSYWADLDLGGDESLAAWREGRWRVIRALARLAGQPCPLHEQMESFLTDLPRQVGRRCPAWQAGALAGMGAWMPAAIVAPTLPASLIEGMLEVAGLTVRVIGPEALSQIGLEGITWAYLAWLAGVDPAIGRLVCREPVPGMPVIYPSADLSAFAAVLTGGIDAD